MRRRGERKVSADGHARERGDRKGPARLLRKNGTPNSGAWALNTQIMIPKVTKSKIELIGLKKTMRRRIMPMSKCAGFCSCSSSTLSAGQPA